MIRQQLERYFAARAAGGDLIAAYLFGSVARGEDGARSDVDVAVLYRRDPPRTFDALPLCLEGEIERLLGRRTELVCLNLAPVDLCARVLRDGLLLVAALDTASHIVSDERLGEPRTNRELFDLLEQAGWIPPTLAGALRDMAGLRNVLVHGYDAVDLEIVRDVVEHHLAELLQFAATVRERISG